LQLYLGGAFEEMNFVYVLIGLVPLFFLRQNAGAGAGVAHRPGGDYIHVERAAALAAQPAAGPQSRDLNRSSSPRRIHIAMGLGYGLAILGAYLSLHYSGSEITACSGAWARRLWRYSCSPSVSAAPSTSHSLVIDLDASYNPIVRFTPCHPVPDAAGGPYS